MPKINFAISFIIISLIITSLKANDNLDFVHGIEDLPLYKGMTNSDEGLVVFDANQGRIIISEIFGEVEISEAENFYYKILPNLGWQAREKNHFSRDEELMQLEFLVDKNQLYIKFRLVPN